LVFLHLSSQNLHTMDIKKSTLCLVDLAGSERITRSQVTGKRLKETQHINKSLSALGDVIYALQHKSKHIPFRNSKLTYILREMLSGKAKTLMMLQLSPEEENVEETICSLQFGARVSQIQLGAVQRSEESGEILRLRQEKKQLEHKMYNLQEKNQELLVKQLKLQEKHEQLLQMHSKDTITHQMMTFTSSTSVATQIISEVASAPASASSSASSSAPAVIEVEDDEEDNIVMEENRLIMMQRAPIEVEEAFDEVRLIAPTDFSSTIRPKTSSPSASLLHRRRSSTSSSGASSTSSTTFSSPSANTRHVSSTSRSSTSSSTVASPMGSSAAASGSVSKRTVSPTPSRRSSLYETKRVHGTGSVVSTSTASLSASASSCRRKKEIACSAPSIVPQGFSSLSSTSGTSRIPRPKAGITKRSSMSSLEDNTRTKSSTSTVRTKRSTSTDTNSNNSRSKALWR
jgi:hypothetical protein